MYKSTLIKRLETAKSAVKKYESFLDRSNISREIDADLSKLYNLKKNRGEVTRVLGRIEDHLLSYENEISAVKTRAERSMREVYGRSGCAESEKIRY